MCNRSLTCTAGEVQKCTVQVALSQPSVCLQSFFSWHVEDVDLLSINYLHYGAAKASFAASNIADLLAI